LFRFAFAFFTLFPFCCAQVFPAFRWIEEVDGSGKDQFIGLGTDAFGNVYVAGNTTSPNFQVKSAVQNHLAASGLSNCFVTKLDPSGNVLYSTYFGGSGGDFAAAMTVDNGGNVYVTGMTGSVDFPTTKGTYAPSAPPPVQPPGVGIFQTAPPASFLFKLNPDGSVGYSTYFSYGQQVQAIATDQHGSAYITGTTYGSLPTTPGAYFTSFPPGISLGLGPFNESNDAFLTRFDANGSTLIYSTYLGVPGGSGNALAVAADDSAYVGGPGNGIFRIDAAGSSLFASLTRLMIVQALTIAPDGSVYAAGLPDAFQPTAGAFQTSPNPLPLLPSLPNRTTQLPVTTPDAIAKLDPQLHLIAGTYFYGLGTNAIMSLALDAAGNLYAGGFTSLGLPTRNPMFEGFGSGFLSELSGDLTTLLFSSYFGSDRSFGVQSVAMGSNGSIVIGGPEVVVGPLVCGCEHVITTPANIWVNSVTPAAPPALRIDSIVNAASFIDGPISAGETIFVGGAGFGSDAQLVIGGSVVPAISMTSTQITAIVPPGVPMGAAVVTVQSGGSASNPVVVPVTATAPGLFSANGNGYGQAYILNKDGTLNTPSNPAAPGDKITIYATGVGPVSFNGGYAVTQFPSNLFIDGIYCAGVAAVLGPVDGFTGNVYRLTVYVPNPANFTFPALDPVILEMDGVSSQYGIAISIAQ
jgi:uncharacterized protein (TIGR03437 family)